MVNPEDYEYLWTDHDVNFIFTSCYLFPEFRNTDFVLIYEHEEKGLKFFLSKKEHEKFSDYGVKFYEKEFPEWKEEIKNNIEKGKKLIAQTKRDESSSLDDSKLKERILDRAKLFQDLGGTYFYTEFFFMEKVEEIVKEGKNRTIEENVEEMGGLKYEARNVLNKFYNYEKIFKPYLEEVAERRGRDDLQWLSYKEIIDVLEGKDVSPSDRGSTNWVLGKKTDWEVIQGEKAQEIIDDFNKQFFEEKSEELEGTIANKGNYRGTAKILRTIFSDKVKEEMKKVEKGDVLIANTTGPEVMAACERAGAIVTDEGGITSHAAIVSRELGIPCVVGTGIASQVFKDGDVVEVDAEEGVVRRLEE